MEMLDIGILGVALIFALMGWAIGSAHRPVEDLPDIRPCPSCGRPYLRVIDCGRLAPDDPGPISRDRPASRSPHRIRPTEISGRRDPPDTA